MNIKHKQQMYRLGKNQSNDKLKVNKQFQTYFFTTFMFVALYFYTIFKMKNNNDNS